MNDLEKQQQFSMQDLSETITNKPLRDDIYELQPLQEVTPPKYKTITEAANEFRFKNQHIKKIQEAIDKEPDANWLQKTGAGLERGIEQLKHSPAEVRNLLYRTLYSGIDYPNADAQKALTIAESSAYQIYLDNQALGREQQAEGTADSIIGNLAQGAFSLGQFALLNLATGGTVGTAIMGAQEAGSLSQSFVEKDIESGAFESAAEYKASAKDNLTAITYGALAGWIEKGIGAEAALGQTWREILKSSGKAAAAKELGKEIIKRGAGEGAEEFLQGEAEWASGKFVGKEDRNVYQGIMDSLISGVYGAVLGGAFGGVSAIGENGVARYYQARSDMIERMTNNGVEPELASQLADQALTDTTGLIVDELAGRNSLHAHFGEQWDKLVDGVAQAYIAQNWEERFPDKDVKEYARMNAISMVAPVIQLSNRTNMPLKQLLDLTRFRANENALFIDLPNMDDPKALGLEVRKRKEEIKRLRGMPATNAKDTIKRLNEQIKVLETRIRGLGVYDSIQKARMDTKKATLDNNVLASTRPEIMADLGGIRQAEKGESFVYVGNNQVPVRYVVKPMAEVQASHIAGEANQNYTLKELQNRTRGTVTDDAILQNRAANLKPEELGISPNTQFGAPVVNKNGEVISGNGRIETLRRAYELGNTSYKEMLDKMGYKTEGIERPVLVRETVEDLTPEQQIAIAEASNVSETSAFDHARQAMNDAKLLKKGISDPLSFADELPVNERQAYIRENGQYDMLALQRRFDDAVLAWIIGDTKTFDSLVLSNRLSQKVVKGLSLQGGNIVDFSKNNPALGIKKDLRYALVKSASIKTRGQFIPSVQQQDIESGITFNADALLYAMTFSSNSSELSNFIGQYVQTHQGYIDSQKDSFLADSLPKLSKEDITNQVLLNNPLTASKFDKDGTCTDLNLKAIILNRIPVENVGYGTIKIEPEESQLFQEQFNLANENARLDDIYPEYKGETININGKERTVYNSNGDRIAKSKEALENFYRWFGDSKVVDEQGRPLVVYHGTSAEFDTFRKGNIFTTDNQEVASEYGSLGAMPLYMKLENPLIVDAYGQSFGEIYNAEGMKKAYKDLTEEDYKKLADTFFDGDIKEAKEWYPQNEQGEVNLARAYGEKPRATNEWADYARKEGYDGVIIKDVNDTVDISNIRTTDYVAFESNQIKSTSNRGTFSKENPDIYYQSAFAGSRVDYDRPSLEAIGSGEGNQAHGWGLYYALNKDVAEDYRKTFVEGQSEIIISDRSLEDWIKSYDWNNETFNVADNVLYDVKALLENKDKSSYDTRQDVLMVLGQYKSDLSYDLHKGSDDEVYLSHIKEDLNNITELQEKLATYSSQEYNFEQAKGQVHEVDIPENPYLLDEQKPFSEQSDFVKQAINRIALSMDRRLNETKLRKLTGDKPSGSSEENWKTYYAKRAWRAGKDFVIAEIHNNHDGDIEQELTSFIKDLNIEDISDRRNFDDYTGGEIYRELDNYYGSPKAASQMLEKYGIKGITYDGRQDGRCFVIFNPADVKVIQKFYQRGKNINGYFDAELKTIVIGSSFNFGTLQHEFAHFFLKRVFDIYKTGEGTQEFNDWFSQLSSILDIKADQFALTTPQQEQFARMTEAYLFNKGEFPDGAKPAMQMFFDWCPKEYNELLTVGWKDEKGVYHNSVFNKESLDFFNDMYSLVPELSDSPLARTFTNQTNRNGTKLPASSETMAEREKLIDENTPETEELTKLENEKPEVKQAYLDIQRGEDPEIKEAYDEAIATEKEREKSPIEKFTQYVRIGRGTNTREEMDELAQDYIKKHRENAERVAFGNPIPGGFEEETGSSLGYVENNTGIDRAVLILNMMNEYAPNSPEYGQLYHNFAIYRSYASKSAGLTNDVNTNYYLKGYAEINKALQTRAALVKYGKSDNAVNLWKRDIDQFISKNIDRVYNTEPESAERDKAIKEFIDEAVATFGGDKALYQEEIRIKSAREKRAFIDWANRTVKKIAKGEISGIDQAKLLDLSVKAQKGASYIDSNNVDEAVAASRSIREWQDFVNQKGLPESFVDKIVGTYLPSAMLSSPSTHALNYISNKFNSLSVQLASRLHYGENVIDKSVLEQEYARLKAIYAESGHNISEDIKPDDVSRLHGEHWQFKKPESALGYLAPMRLLGWSDFYFRAHTYLDVLARIASKDANGDPEKALELFNSYKMMNNTGRAKEARVEAIMTGHIAVFTRNGTLANISAGVRSWLDLINFTNFGEKGHKGLGTMIMPFAKVPSNIVGMGIKAIASPFKLLGKATGLKKDWTLEDSINLTNFGMYGAILGVYLMSGLDYEPPYEPPMKYDPQKPYDSIKIGNAWISVESFGALANPLRFTFTMIDLMRDGKAMQPALSRALQGLKKDIPFADVEFGSDYAFKKPVDWTINQTYNQMSKAVPAIVKKPIAGINRMIGWRIEQDSALTKKIARQYGLDGEQTSINDWLAWIYRGIKIER